MTLAEALPIATLIGVGGTLGFALLNFLRSGMGNRIERLEASEAECQADRVRLERERLDLLERLMHQGK